MLLYGDLPGYGRISVAYYDAWKGHGMLSIRPSKSDFYNRIEISKEEVDLVVNALKSQAGELTSADFYPKKVEEILNKALKGGASMQQTVDELAKKKAKYYQDNHDDIRAQQAQYYKDNKQAIRARRHERYRQHRIEILERRRQRYATRGK